MLYRKSCKYVCVSKSRFTARIWTQTVRSASASDSWAFALRVQPNVLHSVSFCCCRDWSVARMKIISSIQSECSIIEPRRTATDGRTHGQTDVGNVLVTFCPGGIDFRPLSSKAPPSYGEFRTYVERPGGRADSGHCAGKLNSQ